MTTEVPFAYAVVGSTLVDASVAGAVLFLDAGRRGGGGEDPPVVGAGRLALAVALTVVAFVAKLLIFLDRGVGVFGCVHLVYADAVVLVPAAGAALLLASSRWGAGGRPWRRLTVPVRLAAAAALVAAPVGVYATWIEPFRLRVETARVPVPDGREGSGVVRVGVLTDLQTDGVTDYERSAVDRLLAQRPDVILLPGDVFQGTPAQLEATRPALRELLGRLDAPGGVFLVLGDTDGAGDHLRELTRGTAVRLLVNESARVEVRGRRLTIGGVELVPAGAAARGLVERLETAGGDGDVRILLAHRPDVALRLRPHSRIDLVVAGHTHGGQVVIPGFGPPVTLTRVPRAVAAGGLHALAGNAIYVSRGVGCERGEAPRIRFFCPPEVSLLEVGARPGAPAP